MKGVIRYSSHQFDYIQILVDKKKKKILVDRDEGQEVEDI